MRDKLIHFYFGVDSLLVWRAIKERLPQVKSEIQKILHDAGEPLAPADAAFGAGAELAAVISRYDEKTYNLNP